MSIGGLVNIFSNLELWFIYKWKKNKFQQKVEEDSIVDFI